MRRMIERLFLVTVFTMAGMAVPSPNWAQGRCTTTFGSPACNTSDIPPVFAPTEWKTVALDHITFQVADYKKEAAFHIIHTAAFKSYHTDTPNGYNLQISYVTHDNRLALANAVNPAKVSGRSIERP